MLKSEMMTVEDEPITESAPYCIALHCIAYTNLDGFWQQCSTAVSCPGAHPCNVKLSRISRHGEKMAEYGDGLAVGAVFRG